MKSFALFGSLALLALTATAGAATPEEQVLVPVHAFRDSFNKGDMKAMAATLSPAGITVIDDIPPHIWSGPTAFESWGKALEAADKAEGNTGAKATFGKPTRVVVGADRAYVVVPATYSFKQKDTPMRESAQAVYALQKEAGTWLIVGFTWAGTTPKPVAAKAP
jgi:hypothetical protein